MKLPHDDLVRILRTAGYRVLESDASRAVVQRGNRTVVFSSQESSDDDRFDALLGALGMSTATLDALRDVGPPPSSRRPVPSSRR